MGFRAYIVEDSVTIRDNLKEALKELADVEALGEADTEQEGKDWLLSHAEQWDIAIVDLFLREGSGLNVLEACRRRRPQQKMVVLSNHATREIRWRCAQLGADAVFDKSTEIDALMTWCRREQQRRATAGGVTEPGGAGARSGLH
ncbi:response regulator transcription factor [Xylophilus sp.]|uniref:response regulator transcription factor n=1 Tax=Xylophilus sp. TaxID=2653893 RepID=UPI0013B8EE11|nr:response regulator [Xylophilus sp.]KAF1046542.1 MAG: Chemotaxis response regulator protein-glutamate methylesterase [Xylophilus sp.]